jgi:hypothetical protein
MKDMKVSHVILLGTVFFVLLIATIIFLDQVYYWNVFFEPSDFLHHENLALLCIAFATGIIFTWLILRHYNSRKTRRS